MIIRYEELAPYVAVKLRYKVCPSCSRFLPVSATGIFCLACGDKLIDECPRCREPILYPLARHCPVCGEQLTNLERTRQ